MAFTGQLGAADSKLGNIELGEGQASTTQTSDVSEACAFDETLSGRKLAMASASDSLSFMELVEGGSGREMHKTTVLALTEAAQATADRPGGGSDTVTLSDVATALCWRFATVEDDLDLSERHLESPAVTEDLELDEDAVGRLEKFTSTSDTLTFMEDSTTNIFMVTVIEPLGLMETILETGPRRIAAADIMHFTEPLPSPGGVTNKEKIDYLNFKERVGRVLTVSVTQSLGLSDDSIRNNVCIDHLGLVETIHAGKGHDVVDDLGLTDTVVTQATLNRSFDDSLGFTDSASYYVDHGCTKKAYAPFIGAYDSPLPPEITPPSTTVPTLVRDHFTLSYPVTSPTSTVILRNPEFGDKDILSFNRINRETRGGTLIVFASPIWPKQIKYTVQVDALRQSQVDELLAFFSVSLGKKIRVKDWEGRQWIAVIPTPDATVTNVGRGDRSVSFDLEIIGEAL